MTSFPTTSPITAVVDVQWGDVTVVAGEVVETVATVTPTDPSNEKDVRAAEETSVTYADGRLRVVGPKNRTGVFNKRYGSVAVSVQLPTASELDVTTGLGAVMVDGRLGECRVKTSAGDVRVQDATSAELRTGMGRVSAHLIDGDLVAKTGSGDVAVEQVTGHAEVKTANGDARLGDIGGPLRVKSANGSISVGRARGDLMATTANGDLSVGRAESGAVTLRTSMGRIEVGVAAGTAARLDLSTSFGKVRNQLESADAPAAGERTVEIHAQTSAGDIDVVRAPSELGAP